jgi:hypothetical protein
MTLSITRLRALGERLDSGIQAASGVQVPSEMGDNNELRSIVHGRILQVKQSLVTALTGAEAAPTETPITDAQAQAGAAILLNALDEVNQIRAVLALLISPPVALPPAYRTGLEQRCLALRDQVLMELGAIT